MSHTIVVSDQLWDWAANRCNKSEGPATYLRDVLVAKALEDNHKSPSSYQERKFGRERDEEAPKKRGGNGIHDECYREMVKKWFETHSGEEPPFSTPIEAQLRTICRYCFNPIAIGEPIVMTTIDNWE
jgi:hypothetical protein